MLVPAHPTLEEIAVTTSRDHYLCYHQMPHILQPCTNKMANVKKNPLPCLTSKSKAHWGASDCRNLGPTPKSWLQRRLRIGADSFLGEAGLTLLEFPPKYREVYSKDDRSHKSNRYPPLEACSSLKCKYISGPVADKLDQGFSASILLTFRAT